MSMGIGIENVEQACLECDRACVNRRSLGNHVNRAHPQLGGLRGYVLKHLLGDRVPLCGCGCGETVLWHKTHYCFNDYVNSHNCTGFREKQHVFTQEQLDRRRTSIQRAYVERGEEISRKISASVTEGLARSDFDFSAHQKKLWSLPDYKGKQHDSRVRSWEGDAGVERREKVFTKEFGAKISAANARRDFQHTSKQEEAFLVHLKSIFGEKNVRKQWINLEERSLCPDAYIVDRNVYVEFDGVFWHGLDRDAGWRFSQLTHLKNDLQKNRMARDGKFNLVRVRSDVDLKRITDWESLLSSAHHVVIDGKVIKEGTPRLSTEEVFPSTPEGDTMRNELLRVHAAYWGNEGC